MVGPKYAPEFRTLEDFSKIGYFWDHGHNLNSQSKNSRY